MHPLPAAPYEYAEWKKARVNQDYHVEIQDFYYSVPHALIREEVEARLTTNGIELFHHGQRVAVHVRLYGNGGRHVTHDDHMPSGNRFFSGWSVERFRRDAAAIGPNTETLVIAVMASRKHPEQGFRSCLGILKRLRGIDRERAEAACTRAVEIGALSSKSLASILDNNLDRKPTGQLSTNDLPLFHANIDLLGRHPPTGRNHIGTGGRKRIGMGGRIGIGIPGRINRNPQVSSVPERISLPELEIRSGPAICPQSLRQGG
jgi:transposase